MAGLTAFPWGVETGGIEFDLELAFDTQRVL